MPTIAWAENIFLIPSKGLSRENLGFMAFIVNSPRVVAAGDFLFQWWQFEKKLKMSKQEVKEEFKQL